MSKCLHHKVGTTIDGIKALNSQKNTQLSNCCYSKTYYDRTTYYTLNER